MKKSILLILVMFSFNVGIYAQDAITNTDAPTETVLVLESSPEVSLTSDVVPDAAPVSVIGEYDGVVMQPNPRGGKTWKDLSVAGKVGIVLLVAVIVLLLIVAPDGVSSR